MSDDVLECFLRSPESQDKSSNLYKDAAAYFADSLFPVVLEKVCNLPKEGNFYVCSEYDGYEVTVSDNLNNVKSYAVPEIKLLNQFLSEIEIEINVEWDSTKDETYDVDGCLMLVDDEELLSSALVYVNATVPSDPFVAKRVIKSLRQELICVLVHEFRHAVQRILWGWPHENCDDLDNHMENISEIDARVEEMICCFKNQEHVSFDAFQDVATKYIKKYLLRNAKDVSMDKFNDMFSKMLKLHCDYFYKRMKVEYMAQPT